MIRIPSARRSEHLRRPRARQRALRSAAVLALVTAWATAPASAHPGDLDEFGGHFDERTGGYHYHKPVWDLAKRTKEFLNWNRPGLVGELTGVVEKVERPDAIWIKIPYRPAFENLAGTISAQNRDDKGTLVRIWFRYVSPERSALSQDREYVDWFRKKVVFELDRKLIGKSVTVQFEIESPSGRPYGMVLLGEENINVWLVLHGWSYSLLAAEKTPYDETFAEAEQIARREKAGLWGRGG
jgi:hypothetical protein